MSNMPKNPPPWRHAIFPKFTKVTNYRQRHMTQ